MHSSYHETQRVDIYIVGIKTLEQIDSNLEIVDGLLFRGVPDVATRLESVDTGSMFIPLVFPEALVVSLVVFPVYVHVVKESRLPGSSYDSMNVSVLPGWITVLFVGSIAIIWP